jgi:1,2-phenylacetyl-CoA epoxidase PaaB subunit
MKPGIYEVVGRVTPDGPPFRIGSVRAPTPRLALQMGREIFFRREVCEALGIRQGQQIIWSEAAEAILTRRNSNREYRKPSFFSNRRTAYIEAPTTGV